MEQDIFRKVQGQLDQYSLGFPATQSGIEIEILKKLFSPEDAKMFHHLSPKLETPEDIATRLGKNSQDVSEKLADMAARGLVFSLKKNDQIRYGAIPFVHGLFEFQLKRLDRNFSDLVRRYLEDEFENSMIFSAANFLRTIPVQQSLDVKHNIAAYEDASEILKNVNHIVIAECICRKSSNMVDKGCDKPLEVCFLFGSMGQYYLDHNLGRKIEIDEALRILSEAREAGLVTQPATSQNPAGMCNCCGDCCGVLMALNNAPRPSEMVFSNYFAQIEKDQCSSCEACEERCQMRAISMDKNNLAQINLDRCIGCGLCVTTCPTEALKLIEKPSNQRRTPPENTLKQMLNMARNRGII